jgi:hypothetical protein
MSFSSSSSALHKKEDFRPLMQSDDESELDFAASRPKIIATQSLSRRLMYFAFRLLLVTLVVIGLMRLSYDIWDHFSGHKPTRSCSCGSSVDEALSLGCRFDPIAAAWLPEHCRDDELIEDFDRSGDGPNGSWIYYTDFDKTGTMTIEEVGRLADVGGNFFTTLEWHIKHCSYNWKKLFRSRETGVIIENRSNTFGHVDHCEKMFLMPGGLHEVLTGSGVALNADQLPVPKKHKHEG